MSDQFPFKPNVDLFAALPGRCVANFHDQKAGGLGSGIPHVPCDPKLHPIDLL